jgi:hypothetical protein
MLTFTIVWPWCVESQLSYGGIHDDVCEQWVARKRKERAGNHGDEKKPSVRDIDDHVLRGPPQVHAIFLIRVY